MTFQKLVAQIVGAVRAEAAKILDFDNGAIRLLFVPKCPEAAEFLGWAGFSHAEIDVDVGFAIKDGASHTRPAGWRGDKDECDCYGYAALKIEGCAYAVRHNLGRRSRDMPDDAITWGRENDPGAVCYDVVVDQNPDDFLLDPLYLRIYVAVSGADSDEDERCAMAAHSVISDWRHNVKVHGYNLYLRHPVIEKQE